ncbi:MAG TPA: ribosomal protein S18-alanine N-acetyltransferase [Acidimicrobiales bacterium]|nr:ribosomal protein S18-alanine N-acetyltransferase [Acidimicrobiales bacterium]
MALDLDLSPMRRRDVKAVLAIEGNVFPEPWSATIFSSELALRHGRSYKVAKDGRRLVGYRGLMFVGEEAHLTTLAVAPDYQRRGVATVLLIDAVHTALGEGARHLSLEVATGNEKAQALYRRFGFMPVGIRKGYYPVTGEDAFVMWAYDLDSAAYAERLAGIQDWLAVRP